MSENQIRELTIDDIRPLVQPDYMTRGLEVFDQNLVSTTSRYGNKLFANVSGTGSNPYRVSVIFDHQIKAKCTCPAARRTPFCKHATAVLLTWARAPRSFVESETEIDVVQGKARKAGVKKAKVNANELIDKGLVDLDKLLVELATSGLSNITTSRCEQVRELGENLRTFQLRRLSAAVLRMGGLLELSLAGRDAFSFEEYNSVMVDIAITQRAVRQIQNGSLSDEKYQEELIGKTWSRKSLRRIGTRELVQISYRRGLTPDRYLVRERHLIDLESGEIFAEKEIVPEFLAKRQNASFSGQFRRVRSDDVLVYPGFKPNRVKLEGTNQEPVDSVTMEKIISLASGDFRQAVTRHLEFRKDFLAPDQSLDFVSPAGMYYDLDKLHIVDVQGTALRIEHEDISSLIDQLEGGELLAVLGYMMSRDGIYMLQPLTLFCRFGRELSTVVC